MKTYFSGLSESDILEWYEQQLKSKIKKSKAYKSTVAGKQSLLNHDFWSVYAYGDFIRVVYINSAPNTKKRTEAKKTNNTRGAVCGESEKRFSQSMSRTRSKIFELAMCNEFNFFCTFTQDKTKRDRFNLTEFRKDFAQFVRNENRGRENKIKYLLIPEQHKDGAWHMHGLLRGLTDKDLREFSLDENIPQKIKKSIKNGEKIYNWDRYSRKFGYFTCTPIRDKNACSRYVTKYITKDLKKSALERGDHLYFASQGLKGREVILSKCIDKPPFDEWDFENKYVKIKEFTVQNLGQ